MLMAKLLSSVLADIGLGSCPPFLKDRLFHLALFSAFIVWIALWFTVIPTFSTRQISAFRLVALTVLWYPLLEEILFRGIIQKFLIDKSWGRKSVLGLSIANLATSFLFVLAHFWNQPAMWAVTVFIPSLVYGFFRDRYTNIYPSIVLHSFYNAGFVYINIIAQQ
jgi:hypothetical protein